ncbi:uncharacterized protein involved in biosynthesis of c-type cytochromes [Desulfitobacterium dichloroeliminans LMG P-21439]|uniref:Cytochrome c-type biogenesis protein n=1 Tax=Desulfitobacterium dichloroeliminans (strain LMG P-21439 / DCA1) TaxID=871963 RepID=L0F6L6_DESDL|nr:cytochrome c-type biogenesis protein CcmH [Desulfitobacterium dichloroeliminans]AGA68660.1 uncharacterized protein involved in biosynthesis of c-type cytochromes [Desulfitobacterium dichloroeliminans LMG P-21439]
MREFLFRIFTLTLVLVVVGILTPWSVKAEEWQTRQIPVEVEQGVVCVLDGCMMNLPSCENVAAEQLRNVIREKMFKDGLNKEQTYTYLAQIYGEKVLAAPPKKGFNWTVWLAPFVLTIGGGAFIYLGLEKWVIPNRLVEPQEDISSIDPELEKQLDEEIKKYI